MKKFKKLLFSASLFLTVYLLYIGTIEKIYDIEDVFVKYFIAVLILIITEKITEIIHKK